MNLIKFKLHYTVIIGMFIGLSSFAQSLSLSNYNTNTDRLIELYHSGAKSHNPIFNGREYERYPFYINKGIPYFIADSLKTGFLVYDGLRYNDILLLYDQISDELITRDYTGQFLVKLVKLKVDSFVLYGTKFIAVNSAKKNDINGYYELLYDGPTQVLKKDVKKIVNNIRYGEQLEKHVESKTLYVIQHNGLYSPVSSINSLIGALSDKDAIKKIVNDNKKKYKNADLRTNLADAIAKYDQMTDKK